MAMTPLDTEISAILQAGAFSRQEAEALLKIARLLSGGGGEFVASVQPGTGIAVNATDPANPIVALSGGSLASLALADTALQDAPADGEIYGRKDGAWAAITTGGEMPIYYPIEQVILVSQTWKARVSGWHRITAVGGGGGGASINSTSASARVGATGGQGGSLARKSVFLNAGDELAIVIGAAGSGASNANSPGGAGGTTTVTGPGIALSCPGGNGGVAASSATATVTATPTSGAAPTGGDYNAIGGLAGTATAISISGGSGGQTAAAAATGGGACGLFRAPGYSSGNASAEKTQVTTAARTVGAATGGAGVGGGSLSITHSGSSVNTDAASLGGGSSGPDGAGKPVSAAASRMLEPNSSATPATGLGGGGGSQQSTAAIDTSGTTFSGAGGVIVMANSTVSISSNVTAVGGLGGGGGGIAGNGSGSASGARQNGGGQGFVVIEAPL